MSATTSWNSINYLGELVQIGEQANATPFLTMVGGVNGAQTIGSDQFPLAQPWSTGTAAQPSITETASLNAPTPVTYTRAQDTNTTQIFQEQVSVSYVAEATRQKISGLSLSGEVQPVVSEFDFQLMAALKQISEDANYTFLNGTYAAATSAAVAAKTRGILTGITTNVVAAGSADLSREMMDELFRTMATGGAKFANPVIFGSALDVQRLSDLYGFAPMDRKVGGVNVSTIIVPLAGQVSVVWDKDVPAGSLLCAEMSVCSVMATPVPGKGVLFYEELSKTGAGTSGELFGLLGMNYGAEEMSGKITGLSIA